MKLPQICQIAKPTISYSRDCKSKEQYRQSINAPKYKGKFSYIIKVGSQIVEEKVDLLLNKAGKTGQSFCKRKIDRIKYIKHVYTRINIKRMLPKLKK